MQFTKYVAGFLFRAAGSEVALIRKTKPDWQRGKLNGIGGKVEPRESTVDAMLREFREETGYTETRWTKFCTLSVPQASITFFKSLYGNVADLKTTPDEHVSWFHVDTILNPPRVSSVEVLPNLRWLIPMALCESEPFGLIHSDGK